MLRQQVRDAFQAPDGVSDSLQAEVVFMLNASGTVTGVRITTTSGNAAFDRAVLAAFRAMPPLPPPPSGHSGSYSLIFKVHDSV
jgi:TonB family protein